MAAASPLESTGFSDALVILGIAGVVIPAFHRARINPVIGFILVGLAVGPAGLGRFVAQAPWLYHVTISDPHAIEPFAELGIILLLFTIGLELSFGRLWAMRRRVFGLGAAELAGAGLLLGGGFLALGVAPAGAFGLGFALALSSTALVLPIAGTTGPVGERAFAMLLFEDLALVPIIFALGALGSTGGGGMAEIGRTLLLGGLTVAALLFGGRLLLPRLFGQAARTKSPELFLAASMLVVILASILTSAVGLSPIVGALVAGILIAETDYHDEVEAITEPFQGLALGVFLITVGMSLDPAMIMADWRRLLLATASVLTVKTAVTWAILRIGKARAGVALQTSLTMSSPSETTLIVLAAAAAAGLVNGADAAFWRTVTAIGLTATPLLSLLGKRMAHRIERPAPAGEDETDASGENRTLIVGIGRVGRLVAQMFDAHALPYLALDADPEAVRSAQARGYHARYADLARRGMAERLGIGEAAAVVLTMDDPVEANRLTRTLRVTYPDLTIIVRARDPAHAAQLYRAGATDAVPETVESSLQLSEAALVDLGVAMGPVIASVHAKRAQLRDKIMALAETDRPPPLNRRTMVEE